MSGVKLEVQRLFDFSVDEVVGGVVELHEFLPLRETSALWVSDRVSTEGAEELLFVIRHRNNMAL